jgi:hypothetical protein
VSQQIIQSLKGLAVTAGTTVSGCQVLLHAGVPLGLAFMGFSQTFPRMSGSVSSFDCKKNWMHRPPPNQRLPAGCSVMTMTISRFINETEVMGLQINILHTFYL